MKKGDEKGKKEKSKYNKDLEVNNPNSEIARFSDIKKPITY
jgi:hypothetical protein